MSMHDGHRQRLKARFFNEGLDHFDEKHALELLLFYCVPRMDTNPLAFQLIKQFKSFNGVLDATPKELMEVPGVGENIATFISLLKATWRYYETKKNTSNAKPLTSMDACAKYIQPRFLNRNLETVFVLCLDAKCKPICCKMLGEGSVNSASVSIRKIVETALNANATTVILAHNHPGGLPIPSGEDVETTLRIERALKAVEIILAEHFVFADGEYMPIITSGAYSLRNRIDPGEE